jgi:hypothetical protein
VVRKMGKNSEHRKHRAQMSIARKQRREQRGIQENKKRLARLAEIEAEKNE